MTATAVAQVLADVIEDYMDLSPDIDGNSRVLISDQNFDGPKDSGIYILVIYDGRKIIGITNKYDPATGKERGTVSAMLRYGIEVVSKGQDATDRHQEILMSLNSQLGQRFAEDNNLAFYRGGEVLNLSAIEGVASLRRYRIPIIVSSVDYKDTTPAMIDKFTATGIAHEN